MTIKTEDKTYHISLIMWEGEYRRYTPDCFDDLECNFSRECGRDEDGNLVTTEEAVQNLLQWWEGEASNANKGEDGDGLQGLTPEQIEQGDEWSLVVDVD